MDLINISTQVQELALQAGQLCLKMQKDLPAAKFKGIKDLVTEADLACDAFLRAELRRIFPEHGIRTEEAAPEGPAGEAPTWIIDPIDGTVNFSRGIPLWGVSLALVHEGRTLIAVCYLPRLDELYCATRGGGATRNGQSLHVSPTAEMAQAVVSNGDFNVGQDFGTDRLNAENIENFTRQARHCQRVKCVGSAVVEGCFVAAGRLDAYCMTVSYPWDIAGVSLLVEEAGGRVSALDGSPLELVDGAPVLFTNGVLHDKFLDILRR